MVKKMKLKPGVVVVEENDGIFVGHIQKKLFFTNKNTRALLRQLYEWVAIDSLAALHQEDLGSLSETLAQLDSADLLESREIDLNAIECVISHMNEIGTLLAPLLVELGFQIRTLDTRRSIISDVRGQFIRVSDVGLSFKEILAAQRREVRNSSPENFTPQINNKPRTLVILTAYPEPELLASLMSEGIEFISALATPFGALIGPLVKPGISPCFHCVELERSDRDSNWQKIAATLFMERNQKVAMPSAFLAVALLTQFLPGFQESEIPHQMLGATLSLVIGDSRQPASEPSIESTWEKWRFHPACSCHWR